MGEFYAGLRGDAVRLNVTDDSYGNSQPEPKEAIDDEHFGYATANDCSDYAGLRRPEAYLILRLPGENQGTVLKLVDR